MAENPMRAEAHIDFKTTGTDAAGRDINSLTQSIFSFKGAVLAAGAALGFVSSKALVKSVNAFRDFEEQLVEIRKVSGLAGEELHMLGEGLRDLSTELPITAEGFGEIAAAAGRMGLTDPDEILAFSEAVGMIATATDLSPEEAGRGFGKLLSQLDEPIDRLEALGSIVNELSNTFNTTSSEIVEATTRSAAALRFLGVSTEGIFALNSQVATLAPNASRAGSQLNRLAQQLQDPRVLEQLGEAFGLTGQQIRQLIASDPLQFIQALAQIKKEGGPAAEALERIFSSATNKALNFLAADTESLNEAIALSNEQSERMDSLAKEVENALTSLNAQMQLTKAVLHDIFIEIGAFLAPLVLKFTARLRELLEAFRLWNAESDGLYGTLILLVVAVGGLSIALTALFSLFGGTQALINGLSRVLRNPFLLLLGRVVLAALLLYYVFRDDWPEIKQIIDDVIGAAQPILDAFAEGLETIVGWASDLAIALDNLTGGGFSRLVTGLSKVAAFILAIAVLKKPVMAIIGVLGRMVAPLKKILPLVVRLRHMANLIAVSAGGWQMLGRALLLVAARASGLIGVLLILAGLYQANFLDIQGVAENWRSFMNKRLDDVGDRTERLGDRWAEFAEESSKTWTFLSETVDERLTRIADRIEEWLADLGIEFNFPTLTRLHHRFWDFVTEGWDLMLDVIFGFIEGFVDITLSLFAVFFAAIRGDSRRSLELLSELFERILGGIDDFIAKWYTGILKGIGRFLRDALDAVREFGQKLIWGSLIPDIFNDILKFIRNWGPRLYTTVRGALSDGRDSFREFKQNVRQTVRDTFDNIIQEARDWKPTFVGILRDAAQRTEGFFETWKRRLVGSSIVPETFDGMNAKAAEWSGQFPGIVNQGLGQVTTDASTWKNGMLTFTDDTFGSMISLATTWKGDFRHLVKSGLAILDEELKMPKLTTTGSSLFEEAGANVRTALDREKKRTEDALSSAAGALGINVPTFNTSGSSGGSSGSTNPDGSVNLEGGFKLSAEDANRIRELNELHGLARGGIVTGPTRSLIGEAGPEAVLPLRKLTPMMADALVSVLGDPNLIAGSGGDSETNLYFDVTVNADTAEGGRAAGDAFRRELLSQNFY